MSEETRTETTTTETVVQKEDDRNAGERIKDALENPTVEVEKTERVVETTTEKES